MIGLDKLYRHRRRVLRARTRAPGCASCTRCWAAPGTRSPPGAPTSPSAPPATRPPGAASRRGRWAGSSSRFVAAPFHPIGRERRAALRRDDPGLSRGEHRRQLAPAAAAHRGPALGPGRAHRADARGEGRRARRRAWASAACPRWIAEREAVRGAASHPRAPPRGARSGDLLVAWRPEHAGKALKWFVKRLEDPLVAAHAAVVTLSRPLRALAHRARCTSARWSPRSRAGSTRAPPAASGWCASRTSTRRAPCPARPTRSCARSRRSASPGTARSTWQSRRTRALRRGARATARRRARSTAAAARAARSPTRACRPRGRGLSRHLPRARAGRHRRRAPSASRTGASRSRSSIACRAAFRRTSTRDIGDFVLRAARRPLRLPARGGGRRRRAGHHRRRARRRPAALHAAPDPPAAAARLPDAALPARAGGHQCAAARSSPSRRLAPALDARTARRCAGGRARLPRPGRAAEAEPAAMLAAAVAAWDPRRFLEPRGRGDQWSPREKQQRPIIRPAFHVGGRIRRGPPRHPTGHDRAQTPGRGKPTDETAHDRPPRTRRHPAQPRRRFLKPALVVLARRRRRRLAARPAREPGQEGSEEDRRGEGVRVRPRRPRGAAAHAARPPDPGVGLDEAAAAGHGASRRCPAEVARVHVQEGAARGGRRSHWSRSTPPTSRRGYDAQPATVAEARAQARPRAARTRRTTRRCWRRPSSRRTPTTA